MWGQEKRDGGGHNSVWDSENIKRITREEHKEFWIFRQIYEPKS